MSENQLELEFNAPLPTLPQLWTPDDIFSSLDEDTIVRFREDGRVERKRASVSPKDLAQYTSMWANTQPSGGITFIGVENDGKISGCKNIETSHLNDLESVRTLVPDAQFEFRRVPVDGGNNFVLVMRVYYREDKLVETADGSAFVREGDKKRKLTEQEKREIRLNKGELDAETERVSLKFPDDFDETLLAQFRSQYLEKRRLPSRYGIEDVLSLSKLGKKTGDRFQPNLACALLFAKDPRETVPGAFIRVIRYDGEEEKFGKSLNVIADRQIEGPLPLQIRAAEEYIESQIRSFTRLGRDGRFATHPEYPKEVWLEAVVNATVHRSYNLKNMNIFVKMFEDKFVVESPGSFLPPTTAETVFDAHNPRNPHLMWALYYFDYVQCAFEGTRRMREGMRQANLPDPVFAQRTTGTFQVSVKLENDAEHRKTFVRAEAAIGINPDVYASLTESEKMIVNYLADQERVNVTSAGLVIGMDWDTTKAILTGLEEKGIVARLPGKARSRHRFYFLKHKIKKQSVGKLS
ncbi:MAG: putative DNA binding domain-containing protein [Caulobacterales bacterium]|nr:putative DNA binding domain-containing protein [Caulobacterales bacterium]